MSDKDTWQIGQRVIDSYGVEGTITDKTAYTVSVQFDKNLITGCLLNSFSFEGFAVREFRGEKEPLVNQEWTIRLNSKAHC